MSNQPEQTSCFVAVPYTDRQREYFEKVYRPAIQECGMRAVRADEIFKTGAFMRQVVNGIVGSAVVLADLTGRNANVFYEIGLAHAYLKPVIMLTQAASDVPADLLGLRWLEYDTQSVDWALDLRQKIGDAIRACVNASPFERMRDFLPAAVQVRRDLASAADRLADLGSTQKRLFDWLRRQDGPVDQRAIEAEFSDRSGGELFYRLETLRLLGLVETQIVEGTGTRLPVYSYQLSAEVKGYLEQR
jgi:hypothetical protein